MYKLSIFLITILVIPVAFTIDAADEWSAATEMPTHRTEITGAVIGSRIYVIGGFNAAGGTVDMVEIYDPRSDTWTSGKELPVALHHASAATYEGKLYVVGGYREGWIPSNTLFIYDPLANEWIRGADMPTPRGALTVQFVDGILYAVGGWNGMPLGVNEAYDPVTDTWTAKAPMPTPREHLASSVADGKLYVIGGRLGTLVTNLNVNEEYNPVTNTWTAKTPMPSNRGGLTAASLSDSIYVFGGETPVRTFYNNEQYIPSLDAWIVRERMPTARHGLTAVEAGGSIYVLGGGMDPGLSVSGKNEVFTPIDWKEIIHVDVSPKIIVEPEMPTIDDKIRITVSFETNTEGYSVRFGEITKSDKILTSNVIVIPPPAGTPVAEVITTHSHTYTVENLATGDHRFSISINGQKPIMTKFTVAAKTLLIDVSKETSKEMRLGELMVLHHIITNTADVNQRFLYILQVKDGSGITTNLSWSGGELGINESRGVWQAWIPERTGKYTLQIFVWESMENPSVLDSMYEIRVNVS